MKKNIFLGLFLIICVGCGRISPISPELDQRLNNTDGKIDEIRNNQNGLMLELGKINQQQEIIGRDIENAQEGIINLKGSSNSGVQIFSGDAGFLMFSIMIFAFTYSILYYRNKFVKSNKVSEILAQQIAIKNDIELEQQVFMSALNTEVEKDVYKIISRHQNAIKALNIKQTT